MIQAIFFLAAYLVIGLGSTFAFFRPATLSFPTQLSLTFAFGYAVPALIAFALTVGGALRPLPLGLLLSLVTAILWLTASRRYGLRRQFAALAEPVARSGWVQIGLIILAAFAVHRAAFPSDLNFLQSTAFRYWADGAQIADAGAVPEQVMHWGSLYVPTVSKVVLNSFTASIVFLFGTDPLAALGPLLWVASIGIAVGLWAFAHELGLRWTAPFVPILLLANPGWLNVELTQDLTTYKTELVGRMVALAGLAFGLKALRENRVQSWIVAGLLVAVTAVTHVTPAVVAVIAVFWFGVGIAILENRFVSVAKGLAVMALVAVPLVFVVPALAGGDLGFEGIGDGRAYSSFRGEGDPTAFFASVQESLAGKEPRVDLPSATESAEAYSTSTFGNHVGGSTSYVAIGLFTVLAGIAVMLAAGRLKVVGVVAWGVWASLLAISVIFLLRYDTYIPAATGVRRLFDYSSLPVVLVLATFVEIGLARFRNRLPLAAGRAVLGVALVLAVASLITTLPSARVTSETEASTEPFEWLSRNTSCDAKVLAGIRTEGVFEASAGRVALLEGMSPYLRPTMLRDVLSLLTDARRFFEAPRVRRSFLDEHGIDYVLIRGDAALGGARIAPRDAESRLRKLDFLDMVYGSPAARIYEVSPSSDASSVVAGTEDVPGFFCASGRSDGYGDLYR